MARPLRLHVPGMFHHVMSRGNDKREMFIDDGDYAKYLRLLERSAERFGVEVVALCLMPNHVHLLVKPHQHPLSRMIALNGSYCGCSTGDTGELARPSRAVQVQIIEGCRAFLRVLRYVVMNPVCCFFRMVAHRRTGHGAATRMPWARRSNAFLRLQMSGARSMLRIASTTQQAFKGFIEQGVPSADAPAAPSRWV